MHVFDFERIAAHAVAFALTAGLVAGTNTVRADDLQEASKLFKAGQHQQALARVNKAVASKPSDPEPRFLKGLILTEQGNIKEATEIFLKLTQDYPGLPEPYNNLAVIYASQGNYDKARAALEQSIRTHPSYATAYENLGDVYAKLASQAYDKALQLDSRNSAAQDKLALVRELVGGASRVTRQELAAAAPTIASAPVPASPKPASTSGPSSGEDKAPAQPPASKVKAPARPVEDPSGDITEALKGWAQAWSRRDADAYLAYYAKDFATPGGEPRAQWEKSRRARVIGPKSISVGLSSIKVSPAGETRAVATFRQHYRSDVFKGSSNKTLVLVRSDGRWLIQKESAK
jgi:tetratricopeptide (TPR) repeat protein